jgi:hypothetical protein
MRIWGKQSRSPDAGPFRSFCKESISRSAERGGSFGEDKPVSLERGRTLEQVRQFRQFEDRGLAADRIGKDGLVYGNGESFLRRDLSVLRVMMDIRVLIRFMAAFPSGIVIVMVLVPVMMLGPVRLVALVMMIEAVCAFAVGVGQTGYLDSCESSHEYDYGNDAALRGDIAVADRLCHLSSGLPDL